MTRLQLSMRSASVVAVVTFMVGAAVLAAVLQPIAAETGFTVVKKTTGVIMKFCSNEVFVLQDCNERYEGLGWTDRINVLIHAPGWNEDSDKIDVIGTPTHPIRVYTGPNRVTDVDFSETGVDTGVFMGVIKMTGAPGYVVHDTYLTNIFTHGVTGSTAHGVPIHAGHGTGHDDTGTGHGTAPSNAEISSHDRAVLIATEPQDGRITVSWEADEDLIIQK